MQSTSHKGSNLGPRLAALLEVLGIFVAGNFAAAHLASLLGVKSIASSLQEALPATHPDFVAFAIDWTKVMFCQYACLLLPAFAIGWWRRRWGPTHYGVTTAGQSVWRLAVSGLVAFALVALPLKLLWVARHFMPLGPEPAFWALLNKKWTPALWLFLAVSSFGLTPVLEELFYRGYCQSRLEEDFGGIGAIVIVSLFMALGHSSYYHLSFISLGTMVGLIPLCLALGYLFWRTRSLIPAVTLHAAVNIPTKGIYDFLLPAAMLTIVILFRQRWLSSVRDFLHEWAGKGWKKVSFAAATIAIIFVVGFESFPNVFVPLAFLGLAIALLLAFQQWRLERSLARLA